jgi:hypothetical protein
MIFLLRNDELKPAGIASKHGWIIRDPIYLLGACTEGKSGEKATGIKAKTLAASRKEKPDVFTHREATELG